MGIATTLPEHSYRVEDVRQGELQRVRNVCQLQSFVR